MKRKIAAIMAADIAGYSRLVAEDEEETLRRLASYRAVVDDFIAKALPSLDLEESRALQAMLAWIDLSGEEMSVRVVPRQADEFTCTSCFLVHHRSQLAGERGGLPICKDCA